MRTTTLHSGPPAGSFSAPAAMRGVLKALLVAAVAAPGVSAGGQQTPPAPKAPKQFAASVTGLGGPPIQDTPVGTPGTSTMTLTYVTDVDPQAVCNDGR